MATVVLHLENVVGRKQGSFLVKCSGFNHMNDGWYVARICTIVALCETPIEMLFPVEERSHGPRLCSFVERDLRQARFSRQYQGAASLVSRADRVRGC